MNRGTVTLFGASGTMGFEAFKELWKRREENNIILLLRPSGKNKEKFKAYEEQAGIESIPGAGIVEGNGFKIVWGDATSYEDVEMAIRGTDYVLDAMAFISPQADYYPETALEVNVQGIKNIIKAIGAQPNGNEKIKLVYTGTVATTGDRLKGIHWGRPGDPLKPSIFDYYAVTKIAGERAVLESEIKHWSALRLTFIMPSTWDEYADLKDPIMFHQPLDTFMENISARDAGYGMVNCLDLPDDSPFWRRVFYMGGGPRMRITAYEYMDRSQKLTGMSGLQAVYDRNMFATRNFHMQYFEDSEELNSYLHHWRDSFDDWLRNLQETMPKEMKDLAKQCRENPDVQKAVEGGAKAMLTQLAANHKNGTLYWVKQRNDKRMSAFYKNYETFEQLSWDDFEVPPRDAGYQRLNHGYDETKETLDLKDLKGAAEFRGGSCYSTEWSGDLFETVKWECAFGHTFEAKPNTVLKGGHWCPDCEPPEWKFDEIARKNPYFAQVWYPNHDIDENNVYTREDCEDIAGADKEYEASLQKP